MKKLILLIFVSLGLNAANLTIPNTFVANTPAVASEVNGNFGAVEAAVDDNNARIAALEATIVSLETRLSAVENNTVLELDGFLGYSEFNGYPTAEFTAVNVQVNSGLASTSSTPNGLGNIIIGYNESSVTSPEFCSNFVHLDSVQCIGNGFLWGRNVYRGSHNLVMGRGNSYDNFGGIINGFDNVVNGDYSSVLTGSLNVVNSHYSSITGGFENRTAVNNYASISGGRNGYATGHSSSISGGYLGAARGSNSSVSGGRNNYVLSTSGSISGGSGNTILTNARSSSISGGFGNRIETNARYSSISGGNNRSTFGDYDWVAGSLFQDN